MDHLLYGTCAAISTIYVSSQVMFCSYRFIMRIDGIPDIDIRSISSMPVYKRTDGVLHRVISIIIGLRTKDFCQDHRIGRYRVLFFDS